MQVQLTIDGREFTCEFVPSEDAGYAPGKLLLYLPTGGHLSVYKNQGKWIVARVVGNVCIGSTPHPTKREAIQRAAETYAARLLDHEASAHVSQPETK
jgi:hypothetical protein